MTRRGLVIALALAGCAARSPAPGAWIATAAEASRAADEALASGQIDLARERLRRLVESPSSRLVAANDRRVILQDAYFRLAEVELGAHAPARAQAWAESGLALGVQRDLFTANLYIARGGARAALDDARGAAEDYRAALDINEALLADATEVP